MAALSNLKHEHFAQLISSGESATKAYTLAGYSEGGAAQSAARLLRDAKVGARVAELQAAVTERGIEKAAVDRARVLNRLVQLSEAAEQKQQFSAAIRAEELIGKELGMFKDRQEVSGPGGAPIDNSLTIRHVWSDGNGRPADGSGLPCDPGPAV